MFPPAVQPSIVLALASYFAEHPLASDGPPGIARWWLQQLPGADEQAVAQALDWLAAQGLLERVVAADGRLRFRLPADCTHGEWQQRLQVALRRLPALD